MKGKKSAFTLVELLTVLGIIAIVVALLIPALTTVRKIAKETQQKAQLTTIEMGLTAFRNDDGDYPPSNWNNPPGDYCGAQKLTEALVGWDLMGFHPNSAWRADGKDKDGGDTAYTGATTGSQADRERNLKERKGPYLEVATSNVFRLGNSSAGAEDGLFDDTGGVLDRDRYVLCDVFAVRRINISSGSTVKAGTPILYYKANTSSRIFDPNASPLPEDNEKNIYNAYDNFPLIILGSVTVDGSHGEPHPLGDALKNLYKFDYGEDNVYGIRDSKITARPWPHRPDSYILISAGADGLYGTSDDIHNF